MLSLKGYDFRGSVVYDREARRLLGVHYETDGYGTAMARSRDAGNAGRRRRRAARNRQSHRMPALRRASPTVLVTASSDRQPPHYYVYDRDTKTLTSIAASRPWIEAQATWARATLHRFTARDGAVDPRARHASARQGERRRGRRWCWCMADRGCAARIGQWEPHAQFLASRGYVVIEPEFRGSEGYGFTHFRAGWKQWGRAMQDDVADAVQWAVEQGWVDAEARLHRRRELRRLRGADGARPPSRSLPVRDRLGRGDRHQPHVLDRLERHRPTKRRGYEHAAC